MPNPSSERRRTNLHAVVLEFTRRDIGPACVSALLGCSLSASRYYLATLLEAGLVAPQSVRPQTARGKGKPFTLSADAAAVQDFLDGLAAPRGNAGPGCGDNGGQVHRVWHGANHWRSAARPPARRDPLVAALFGAAVPA
ncbi:hypothetical protein ACI48D_11970 [Massilia sp. LXY-6]|uniref:hypothetical protein n=1 Tax=Massilia sp. LXY-6 TaxID=3379823 RepID=UPI003EDF7909